MSIESSLQQKIDLARRELLDMGLRANPLLNFNSGTKSLSIVEESAGSIFEHLVRQKKSMRFLPMPEPHRQADNAERRTENESVELPPLSEYLQEKHGDSRFLDNYLQTSISSEKLDTTLLRIENEAHTLLQEQGIDVLYLATGFLTWFEDSQSSTPRQAPLLLIPVTLLRRSAKEVFSIAWTEEDLSPNLALAAKLKSEFWIELPDFDDEYSPEVYFQRVQEAITTQPRWQVDANTTVLGLFSFGKFQMFNDLDPDNWPEGRTPLNHPIINGLLGQGFPTDLGFLDDIREHPALKEPEKLQLVKDADSSQTEAILAVMRGANLVIQGPPGTGKSQTITNIISEGLAQGKKILFVAQKMAALEVVKKRLDESHLGDAVLELHSHKTTKKAFIDSLRLTLDQARPTTPDRFQEYIRLKTVRSQLNDYVLATGEPILNSGETFVKALGKQLKWRRQQQTFTQLQKPVLPELDFSVMMLWDREKLAEAVRVTDDLAAHIKEKGIANDNPFVNSCRTSLSPQEQQQINNLIIVCLQELANTALESRSLSFEKHFPEANSIVDIEAIYRATALIIIAPDLQGMLVDSDDWRQKKAEIRQLVHAGKVMAKIKNQQQERFIAQAFDADLLAIRTGFVGRVDKWWRGFSSSYRNAKAAYLALCKTQSDNDKPTDWLNHVDELLVYQEQRKNYLEHQKLGETLFQQRWQKEASDWASLEIISEWLIDLYEEIDNGDALQEIIPNLGRNQQSTHGENLRLDKLAKSLSTFNASLKELLATIEIDSETCYERLRTDSLERLEGRLLSWQATDKLYNITRYNQICNSLKKLKLDDLGELSKSWSLAPEDITITLLNSYYSGLINHAYSTQDAIRLFDRLTHERAVNEFITIDKALFEFTKENLVNTLYTALPNKNASGEMDIIRREINKKRRHLPIRRLITEAGHAIQQIKPVFMMSPMSVATYLPQGDIEFDLVIFDEASQIPAPDAFGAIARAKQVVVVGDSKQMPPTNFFGRAIELDDEEAELSATADVESILSLMLAKGLPETMLRWHYRSRHHSLIATSNAEFYNNKLMVFPSPGVHPEATGLKLNVLDTVYDRGNSRVNRQEAHHIAETVIHHARTNPHLSLGVVAFSTTQRDAIILEVEKLRRENPDLEPFFDHHSGDEFFIKNLENVQGDERDVIYISVGYGRTVAGKVSQNFGPLNSAGGERRLNVLITRARMAMEVFCNFTADELVTTHTSSLGLKAFKAFLKYAQTGELPKTYESGKKADLPFEEEIHKAIEALGYHVEPQLGCHGFSIDFAVRDPNKPERYILAVECDGASYHSSAFARDRDRIRQSVLEELGWRFHRIWSTDWFRNANGEIKRLKAAIEQSVAYYQLLDNNVITTSVKAAAKAHTLESQIVREEQNPEQIQPRINHYVLTSLKSAKLSDFASFDMIPTATLDKAIRKIVDTESVVHTHMLINQLTTAAGLARTSPKIRRIIVERTQALAASGKTKTKGEFLVSRKTPLMEPRDWSSLERNYRKVEYVSDFELEKAIELTVREAFTINKEECLSATLGLIGFKRSTAGFKSRVDTLINQMINDKRLILENNRLRVS